MHMISGIVELKSGEIAEDLAAYLVESEQQNAALALGVSIARDGSIRAAGGFLIQVSLWNILHVFIIHTQDFSKSLKFSHTHSDIPQKDCDMQVKQDFTSWYDKYLSRLDWFQSWLHYYWISCTPKDFGRPETDLQQLWPKWTWLRRDHGAVLLLQKLCWESKLNQMQKVLGLGSIPFTWLTSVL